ncbi:tyrosine-protein kinase BAZ1B-like [Macrosteles quadrilineatus]|uniref:tyrosine-protein kinase BAZ1B-like n=1 Tax=Macrosteles quadrilineatus TaxID=74068 RepID=UPI0023E0CE90|nr:tyrosine-protein kinase BAZ1B-like [Macrosteles quadrilineatus]
MYILPLLVSLLQCSYQLGKSLTQEIPTKRFYMNQRDLPGDSKRRRQESIQLKPPPADWPSPTLGAADFLYDLQEVTSFSPLQAYQHKLQEEYLKNLEEQSHKKPIQNQPIKEEESVWSSSDEDFKKLLDPNELLKLNKKLAPILTKQNKIGSTFKKILNEKKKTIGTGTTPSSKLNKITSTISSHLKKNEHEAKTTDNLNTSLEHKKTRIKKRLKRKKLAESKTGDKVKSRRRKAKSRKFAFDVHGSGEHISKASKEDVLKLKRVTASVELKKKSSSSSESSSSSSSNEEIHSSSIHEHTTEENNTTSSSLKTTTEKYINTRPTVHEHITSIPAQTEKSSLKEISSSTESMMMTDKSTVSARKMELREKRRQIKMEMKKVLKEEDLEGSFGDRDSEWTTSEPSKLPIHKVTPKQALFGILKHKILRFVDNLIRSSNKEILWRN